MSSTYRSLHVTKIDEDGNPEEEDNNENNEQTERIAYLPKPGIAVPRRRRFRPLQFSRWAVAIVGANAIAWLLLQGMTTQRELVLPASVKEVQFDLELCDLEVTDPVDPKQKYAAVSIQHWNFLGEVSRMESGDDTAVVKAHMGMSLPMFRCRVSIQHPPSQRLERVHGQLDGEPQSKLIVSAAPTESMEFWAHDASISMSDLSKKVNMTLEHGHAELLPLELHGVSELTATVHTAALLVSAPGSMEVTTEGNASEVSVFGAPSVHATGNKAVLSGASPSHSHIVSDADNASAEKHALAKNSSGSTHSEVVDKHALAKNISGSKRSEVVRRLAPAQLQVSFESLGEGPGYFQAGGAGETYRGKQQDPEAPTLTAESEAELKSIHTWMEAVSKAARPWAVRMRIRGPGLTCGSWQVVSSEAYLMVKLEWLAMVSANLLHPVLRETTVQLLGLKAQWPPATLEEAQDGCKDAPNSQVDRLDETLMQIFQAMYPALKPPEGATISFVPDGSFPSPVLFTERAGVWRTSYLKSWKGQTMLFICALALNVAASVIGASAVLYIIGKYGLTLLSDRMRRDKVTTAASQRITHYSASQTWRVLATQINTPHGVLLRWTKKTGQQRPAYYWIYAVAQEDTVRGYAADEVCIERIANEKVMTMAENTNIKEFFFSVNPAEHGASYESGQRNHDLKHMYTYRFRIEGCDLHEDTVCESEWSNEVTITPQTGVFELPFLVVREVMPVSTASFGYFVDHLASRHVKGKSAQQIVVLSNLEITYHKNFRDLKDCNEYFYITAFAGPSRDACEKDTFTNKVKTFAKTVPFRPPREILDEVTGDELDDDQRTRKLEKIPGVPTRGGENVLRFGRLNDEEKAVTFRLHWLSSGDDMADVKMDWADLEEEFEEETEEGKEQLVELCLVPDKEKFDEDWLVCLTARLTFESSVDPLCKEIERDQRFFTKDAPGQVFYSGMERFVTWDPTSPLYEGETIDLIAEFPDLGRTEGPPKIVAKGVPREAGGVNIMLEFPHDLSNDKVVSCQLVARDSEGRSVESSRFIICRTWLLSDMEHMYASFCKMNEVEMQHLTKEVLTSYGVSTTNVQLKGLENVRQALPFETDRRDLRCVYECHGTFTVGDHNIVATRVEDLAKGGDDGAGDDHSTYGGASTIGDTLKERTASGSGFAGSKAVSSKDKDMGKDHVKTFVVTSERCQVLESIWPHSWVMQGTEWRPTMLLQYRFYPVDNIMNFFALLCSFVKLDSFYYVVEQYILGNTISSFLLSLFTAPIVYVLPFFAESLLFLFQFCSFMVLPLLLLFFATLTEYFGIEMNHAALLVTGHGHVQSYLPDLVFSSTYSGRNLSTWLEGLSPASRVSSLAAAGVYILLVMFIIESNFVRDAWPSALQPTLRTYFNEAGKALVGFCIWCLAFVACMSSLWFVMAVVIYPEQMIAAMAVVGGVFFLSFSMLQRYRLMLEQITSFLKDEIPEILDLVCDNFLQQYERTDLTGASQLRKIQDNKLIEVVQGEMRRYLSDRFDSGDAVSDLLKTAGPNNRRLFQQVFERALVKQENWSAVTRDDKRDSADSAADDGRQLKTTEQILNESGLTQEDTSELDHFAMRVRLSDRETELRDRCVHQYSEDLRLKLMNMYTRLLQDLPMNEDVEAVLTDSKKFGRSIYRAQKSKLEVFGRSKKEGGSSLLQLFISDVNQQQLKNYEHIIAEFVETHLDSETIGERMTSYIWREVPMEIQKEVRLTLDEQVMGSSMQKILEQLRRWKGRQLSKGGDSLLRQSQTLERSAPTEGGSSSKNGGLMKMLEEVGIVDKSASANYRQHVWRSLEHRVREWRDEDEQELVVNSTDTENFVRELLQGKLWWGALSELLQKLGFPMQEQSGSGTNDLPFAAVRDEFETNLHVMKNGGFLPRERVPDFLCGITRADSTDGGCGRLWRAQLIALMQRLETIGFINSKGDKKRARKASDMEAPNDFLHELVHYSWPKWLQDAWNKKASPWTFKDGRTQGDLKLFMPKSEIYGLLQEIAFLPTSELPDFKKNKVDDEYDNWAKHKDDEGRTTSLWTKRGKAVFELRGIWQECFIKILEEISNGVTDRNKGIRLFDACLAEQQRRETGGAAQRAGAAVATGAKTIASSLAGVKAKMRRESTEAQEEPTESLPVAEDTSSSQRAGLLSVGFLITWLRENLVQNTGECSLQVFSKVLEKCDVTLPKIVVDYLWHSAEASKRFENSWALRNVADLERRIVMYLVRGLPAEAVEGLLFDVLSIGCLQDISKKELKTTFQTLDVKLGSNGFLEPREIKALITFIAQAGMTLTQLMDSLKKIGCEFPETDVKEAFLLLDTSADDMLDMPEFLGLIDYIIVRLIPQQIKYVMNLQPHQIFCRLLLALFTVAAVCLFVVISLGAFHVNIDIGNEKASGGASAVRAGAVLFGVFFLKQETSEEDEERFFKHARERLYAMMGITQSQIDARRRALGMAGPSFAGRLRGKNSGFKFKQGADKDDDDDDADDS